MICKYFYEYSLNLKTYINLELEGKSFPRPKLLLIGEKNQVLL